MIKILIVDDEPIVRIGFKSLGDWEKEGFIVGFEAGDGIKALEILRRHPEIDIIITDIYMPVMDGIELIKKVNEDYPDKFILVLSAYSEYELVRTSFKSGIYDYIVKTKMEFNLILSQLNDIRTKINRIRESKNEVQNDENKYRNKLLKEMLENKIDKGTNITLEGELFLFICILVDNSAELKKGVDLDNNFSNNLISIITSGVGLRFEYNIIDISYFEYALLLKLPKANKRADYLNKAKSTLNKIQGYISSYMNISITMGLGNFFSDTSKVYQEYQQAKKIAQLRFVYGTGKAYSEKEMVKISKHMPEFITPQCDALVEYLKNNQIKDAMHEFDKIATFPNKFAGYSIGTICAYYTNLLYTVFNVVKSNVNEYDLFDKPIDLYEVLSDLDTFEDVVKYSTDSFKQVISRLDGNAARRKSDLVIKAEMFICKNYMEPNINVQMVSYSVGVSPKYFSSIFLKEVGVKFTDYLQIVRINQAKRLTKSTQLKDYEIALEVGIENAEYYSKLFKKITGLTSNEYRGKAKEGAKF